MNLIYYSHPFQIIVKKKSIIRILINLKSTIVKIIAAMKINIILKKKQSNICTYMKLQIVSWWEQENKNHKYVALFQLVCNKQHQMSDENAAKSIISIVMHLIRNEENPPQNGRTCSRNKIEEQIWEKN